MARLSRKLWVGIGAATIAGASMAGAAAQGAHKDHNALQPRARRRPTRRRAGRPISPTAAPGTRASASIATSRSCADICSSAGS